MVSKVSSPSVSRPNLRAISPEAGGGPTAGDTYTVRAGDTLSQIAHKAYGDPSKWTLIRDANGLSGDKVGAGATLKLPSRERSRTHSEFQAAKPQKVDLGASGPALSLAELEQRAQDTAGVSVNSLGARNTELLKKVDAAGNRDGHVQLKELASYYDGLGQQMKALQAKVNSGGATDDDVEKGAKLVSDMKLVGGLLLSLRDASQTAREDADLAKKIDGLVKDSGTGRRLGNADGKLSRSEVERFITDRTTRAVAATKQGDASQAQQEQSLAALGRRLLNVLPK